MKINFIKRQILDEREEQLVNKAGSETVTFLTISLFVFGIGATFISKAGISPSMLFGLIILASFYQSYRCYRLGVRFANQNYLSLGGVLLLTAILSLFIWAQNFQYNAAIYQGNPLNPMFLSVLPITFLFNLPIVGLLNLALIGLSKSEQKRYEAYLNKLENDE